jgi:restriction system protein
VKGFYRMAVPTYDKLMLPLLQYASDGQPHHIREAITALADVLHLSPEDREEMLPKSNKYKFDDRVQWANTYLKKAGLLQSAGRGYLEITDRGLQVLRTNPPFLDRNFLRQFPEFEEFQRVKPPAIVIEFGTAVASVIPPSIAEQTPEELIQTVHSDLNQRLADELLEVILSSSPAFFEQLVVDLLVAMGYGGSLGTGERLGRSGDGGVDGYIYEDKLGLNIIYVQAKRYSVDNIVGRPALQGFAGSLMGERASKGVFITTSSFSKQALEYAYNVPNVKIIPIDGQQLTQLMIEHNVGVSVQQAYVVKKVDRDYFDVD